MKKFLSFIITPVLALSLLAGCSKVERTGSSVQNLFATYMDSYISGGQNKIFKNNVYASDSEQNETDYTVVEGVSTPTYEKIMYVIYDDTNGLNTKVNGALNTGSSVTEIQASQLKTIYQRILSLTFNYYANWQANFFAAIGETEMTNDEYIKLYESLIALQEQTDEFVSSKAELERNIRMNGFSSSMFNSFNSAYNKLILSSFDYVNLFKEYHEKYIFNTNATTPSAAKRLVDQSLLLLAEGIFYDNVLAFEQNGVTDIHGLYGSTSPYIWTSKSYWQDLTVSSENSLYANSNLDKEVGSNLSVLELLVNAEADETLKNAAIARVENLYLYCNSFEQDLNNYIQIFNNSNLVQYNQYRFNTATDVSLQQKSNYNFMSGFAFNKISNFMGALLQVVNTVK